jgi:hypothetical protein
VALGFNAEACVSFDPMADSNPPVKLARQFEAFGTLYPQHRAAYRQDSDWRKFCQGLLELWDLVWVTSPAETRDPTAGDRKVTEDKLAAILERFTDPRNRFIDRVRSAARPVKSTFNRYDVSFGAGVQVAVEPARTDRPVCCR